jgi:hypothetical protein
MSKLANSTWQAHLVSIDEFAAELRKVPEDAFSRIDSIREYQRRFAISGFAIPGLQSAATRIVDVLC